MQQIWNTKIIGISLGDVIRTRRPKVERWRLVWFALAIPKQAFIIRFVFCKVIITGEKLLGWGMGGDVSCVFCRGYIESADHLFFRCLFSSLLWKTLMSKGLIPDPPIDWSDIVCFGISNWRSDHLRINLAFCCLSSLVAQECYKTWKNPEH